MRTSDQTDKLMPALLAARRAMTPVFKGKRNDHFKYTYANEEAWHDAIQPALLEHGLLLAFSVDATNRSGSLTTVHGSARVTHAESGQWCEITGVGEGEDKNDKAAYKAQTGLKKYLYALAFALPTTDDVEDPAHDKRRAAEAAAAAVRATAPALPQAQVNAALVADGHAPQYVDTAMRDKAKALFDQAKVIDKAEANRIKRQFGTDYERIAEELDIFLRGVPKAAP